MHTRLSKVLIDAQWMFSVKIPHINPILLDLPTEFFTERLRLRCYRPGDGAMYFRELRANRDHLYEFLPANLMDVQSEADTEVVIRKLGAEWQLRNLFIFGVWERDTEDYVGETYLANADWRVPRFIKSTPVSLLGQAPFSLANNTYPGSRTWGYRVFVK